MFVKKFYGQTMKAVLQQAKETLGEDLVILARRTLEGGRLELTAAIDRTGEPGQSDRDVMGEELSSIKEMILSLMEGESVRQLGKAALFLYRELKRKGMSESGARQIVQELSKGLPPEALTQEDALRGELRKLIFSKIETTEPLAEGKICIALVGRTGVGKTTTLAKLASRERYLRKRRVALVSLDASKVGSLEELKRIGNLLDAPAQVVYERSEIPELLKVQEDVDTLFVDTPGRGLDDGRFRERIFDLLTCCPNVQFHLLVSPHFQREVLVRDIEEYGRLSLKSLILTKVDESRSMGTLLDVVLSHSVPVSWMTTGQGIPHDIHPVNKGFLFDRLMEA